MRVETTVFGLRKGADRPEIDWVAVEQIQRRARRTRAEVFTQAFGAPWAWIRVRVERARAPLDFAPVGTCP